jgi:TPR repeat protein
MDLMFADRIVVSPVGGGAMPLSGQENPSSAFNASSKLTVRLMVTFLSAALLQVIPMPSAHAFESETSSTTNVLQQARAYSQGVGVRLDSQRAAVLFQQAMDQGSLEAMASLGNLYVHGRGVAKDDSKGIGLITAAADQGDPVGLRFAGTLYEEGQAVPQDFSKAKAFYERAAAKGDAPALGRLGMMYLFGRGVLQDEGKGKEFLKKGSAAGDVWSKVELGRVYGSSANAAERPLAIAEYMAAAQAGNRVASYRLGRIYEFGLVGQTKDITKAVQFYTHSMTRGNPFAQLAMGRLYMTGNGVEEDDIHAYEMFILAAAKHAAQAEVFQRELAQRMSAEQIAQASALAQKVMATSSQDDRSSSENKE